MQLLNLTLSDTAENLALDEALIESAENDLDSANCLRFWESTEFAVIAGRSSKLEQEINLTACRDQSIPIYRRCSGGASIVAGAGCLMYSVLLSYHSYPQLRMLQQAHQFILGTVAKGLSTAVNRSEQLNQNSYKNSTVGQHISQQGTSDLTWQERKFSGNSMRCKQNHLLYHGTILYDFPLEKIGQLLLTPPRLPKYRNQRSHAEFITNLPLSKQEIQKTLINSFGADESKTDWPQALTRKLVTERYRTRSWNWKH